MNQVSSRRCAKLVVPQNLVFRHVAYNRTRRAAPSNFHDFVDQILAGCWSANPFFPVHFALEHFVQGFGDGHTPDPRQFTGQCLNFLVLYAQRNFGTYCLFRYQVSLLNSTLPPHPFKQLVEPAERIKMGTGDVVFGVAVVEFGELLHEFGGF
jgi:hypothetical protein